MKNKVLNWLKTKKDDPVYDASYQVRLVEGIFEPAESADVLLSLLNYKIKFHTVQLLNLQENDGKNLEQSKKRIEELKLAKKRVTDIVLDARNKGEVLEIQSTITIIPKSSEETF
ncbi:hypothetical protein [Flagellimonas meridianipacifica]|uniref:Uncharacterized protein n=1 Tax=Flagellimonas meridianipacifica TaxID=1080225 RepID=A0A2T0MG81_9FLAO|nr:hypothetical protein [Allomuricauda pacifica]PRX56564.1 hypothetical protein CLV81_0561 [Allomuricauda pacifica]